jgi:hypothetical protein
MLFICLVLLVDGFQLPIPAFIYIPCWLSDLIQSSRFVDFLKVFRGHETPTYKAKKHPAPGLVSFLEAYVVLNWVLLF